MYLWVIFRKLRGIDKVILIFFGMETESCDK